VYQLRTSKSLLILILILNHIPTGSDSDTLFSDRSHKKKSHRFAACLSRSRPLGIVFFFLFLLILPRLFFLCFLCCLKFFLRFSPSPVLPSPGLLTINNLGWACPCTPPLSDDNLLLSWFLPSSLFPSSCWHPTFSPCPLGLLYYVRSAPSPHSESLNPAWPYISCSSSSSISISILVLVFLGFVTHY
jgi:hypothetical protein